MFFFSSRRRHTRSLRDWSSDVCSSDLFQPVLAILRSGGSSDFSTTFGSLAAFGTSWGGEFRDGAAALLRLGRDQVDEISQHYLQTVFIPVIPKQLTQLFGLDKDVVATLSSPFVMQQEYHSDTP